jgi:phospholipid transport system transporter-binding protein
VRIDAPFITMENAASLLDVGVAAIARGDTHFDFSAVGNVDSAAVALVLAWQRAARAQGASLTLAGVPDGLLSLARLYGVESLLDGERRAVE